MDKKTDLVFEYFEKKYGFDIEKLGIDKYQIQHIFENNHRYFDKKDSIKILILHIEKMIDNQIKDNKKKIISNSFLQKEQPVVKPVVKKETNLQMTQVIIDSKDRDYRKFKFPSYFIYDLKKSIKKEFTIKQIILKTTTKEKDSSDNTESIPYLVLDLNVKGIDGSNECLENGVCILSDYQTIGDYRYYNLDQKISIKKDMEKLFIKINKPDGKLYNLGTLNNDFIGTVVLVHLEFYF